MTMVSMSLIPARSSRSMKDPTNVTEITLGAEDMQDKIVSRKRRLTSFSLKPVRSVRRSAGAESAVWDPHDLARMSPKPHPRPAAGV